MNKPLIPTELKTQSLANPIGIDTAKPQISWQLTGDGTRGRAQSAYQVTVGRTEKDVDLWDSGKVSSTQMRVDYQGSPLRAGERAFWRVRVWDERGAEGEWSKPSFWEAGLVHQKNWQGKWIGSSLAGGTHSEVPAPFLRREFELKKPIARARLYVSALGLYEFHLNGQRVGNDVFTPGWTDYRKRVQYQTYDVTGSIKEGKNCAGAILGDGWWSGYVGNLFHRQFFGDQPWLRAQLVVKFTDGSEETIVSDDRWRVTTAGPILASDFMMGEAYDARREIKGWDAAGFQEDASWSPVTVLPSPSIEITARPGPLVGAIKELKPKSIRKLWQGAYVIDMGQNMSGWVRLKMRNAKAGKSVTLRFAEVLEKDGKVYTANLRGARQTDHYTPCGASEEVFEPRFTFHGFRYVDVRGYPGELSADDLTGVVLCSRIAPTGSFECSEPLVNQLQQNIQWGQWGNFIDVPTDCPQRDERLGWTGDAQVFARTAAYNADVSGFFAKWCLDLQDSQRPNGSIPCIAPNILHESDIKERSGHSDGGPAWSDVATIVPWTMYLAYGDRGLLDQQYDMVAHYTRALRDNWSIDLIRSHPDLGKWRGFGDWLATDAGRENVMGLTPHDLIGTAFLSYSANLTAKIAHVLGREQDQKEFQELACKSAGKFVDRFVTKQGLITGATQTSYVLALHFDLLPDELRPVAIKELVRDIEKRGNHLSTGFVGTPYLMHVLSRFGRLDVAYRLLFQKTYPGWLFPVTQGATTIWERWDGWTEEKGFQDPGMNSFNHYAYGAVGDWLYQVVAGIEIDPNHPGYEHILFRPHPAPRELKKEGIGFDHVKATYKSVRGQIESAWRLSGEDQLHYDVEIPIGSTATAWIPGRSEADVKESGKPLAQSAGVRMLRTDAGHVVVSLGSGRYSFESKMI